MEKFGLDLDDEGSSSNNSEQTNPRDPHKQFIQRWINLLPHVHICKEHQCRQINCMQLKEQLAHAQNCVLNTSGKCDTCKQLDTLNIYHAKQCNETECVIPFCSSMKQTLEQQKIVQRIKQEQTLIRRVAAIDTDYDID